MDSWQQYQVFITDCSNHHKDTETLQKKEPGEGIPGVAYLNHVTLAWPHFQKTIQFPWIRKT